MKRGQENVLKRALGEPKNTSWNEFQKKIVFYDDVCELLLSHDEKLEQKVVQLNVKFSFTKNPRFERLALFYMTSHQVTFNTCVYYRANCDSYISQETNDVLW